MRVLFVSDVFFPRVNGVSTSIATFRADLERLGVETLLVAPRYAGETVSEEHGVVRVAGSKVPGDPEDRRMRWGALRRVLAGLERESFDLIHVHTPFVAHYAGVREARRRGVPVLATYHTFFEEYLHHYVPVLPRPLGRTLARAFTRSQCSAVQALVAPSEPLRWGCEGVGTGASGVAGRAPSLARPRRCAVVCGAREGRVRVKCEAHSTPPARLSPPLPRARPRNSMAQV